MKEADAEKRNILTPGLHFILSLHLWERTGLRKLIAFSFLCTFSLLLMKEQEKISVKLRLHHSKNDLPTHMKEKGWESLLSAFSFLCTFQCYFQGARKNFTCKLRWHHSKICFNLDFDSKSYYCTTSAYHKNTPIQYKLLCHFPPDKKRGVEPAGGILWSPLLLDILKIIHPIDESSFQFCRSISGHNTFTI